MLGARAVVARAKVGIHMLLLQPAQEFLVARIGQDFFDSVVFVTELVVRPRFVDEIFAGAAGRNDFAAAFATWHDVMAAGGDVAITEFALLFHDGVFECHKHNTILKMVGEEGLAPSRLTDSRSVGSAIPAEPLAQKRNGTRVR